LEIDVLLPQDLAPARAARWAELQGADLALDSPFLGPDWALAVERAQGERAGIRVAVLSDGGRDLGFLTARAGALTAMPAGAPMCDYQALVAEPGVEIDARRLVRALGVQRLDFSCMLQDQPAFAPYLRGASESYVVDVSEGYAAYEADRRAAGTGILKDAERKRRKAEREAGVVFEAFSGSAAAFDQMIAWKSAQYRATGQTDIFATPWTGRLLKDLFERRTPAFGGGLFTLTIGGELAAAQFNLCGPRTVHGWMITHNPKFERYSPGIMLFQQILRWMDGGPYRWLDLGYGDYRFKRELSNRKLTVAHGFVGLPSPAALARGVAYSVRRTAEALPLGPVSELPGKAMRRLDLWRGLRSPA
jgi:CelD/BcsL family acetyltransferase involved in cellulose biosynthesis